MNRIDQRFAELKQQGKKALIPYITAGDPQPAWTVELMHTLVEAGADIIELGVPFSDPMADGPVIQLACERALVHNTRLVDVLDMVKTFRLNDATTPVVLMGYLNPIEVIGYDVFAQKAQAVGVDGVLVVDMPPEESEGAAQLFTDHNLKLIYLLAPTSRDERISKVCHYASGYLYYVSVRGVTGSAALDVADVERNLARIRSKTSIPLGVGFGIKDGASAAAVAAISDAVIVGSALVNQIEANQNDLAAIKQGLSALLSEMRSAMDA